MDSTEVPDEKQGVGETDRERKHSRERGSRQIRGKEPIGTRWHRAETKDVKVKTAQPTSSRW